MSGPAFASLAEAVENFLMPRLAGLGFREVCREPDWCGGEIVLENQDAYLYIVYEWHDLGLGVRLGARRDSAGSPVAFDSPYFPAYTEYTAALGIPDEHFREACGGWRPGFFQFPDLEAAFDFLASTLPIILPRQAEIESAIRDAKRTGRGRRRPRRKRGSSRDDA